MELPVNSIETVVEGDLDLRGTLGLDREVGAGFTKIRVRFEIDAPDVKEEDLAALVFTAGLAVSTTTYARSKALIIRREGSALAFGIAGLAAVATSPARFD